MTLRCYVCYWEGDPRHALTAPNPFDPHELLIGCPLCGSANSLMQDAPSGESLPVVLVPEATAILRGPARRAA